MWKKGDLSDFEHGMVVGARRAGLSISETADPLGLSCTTISRVYREWSEKGKHPVSQRPGATPVSSPKLDKRRLEKCFLV
uniref:Tc3 transposase DNA binding domain-containing protein n=1 Tax=Denticeps clupeoides TaxID=299321 RepID=A0AAY4DM64_9TELE